MYKIYGTELELPTNCSKRLTRLGTLKNMCIDELRQHMPRGYCVAYSAIGLFHAC